MRKKKKLTYAATKGIFLLSAFSFLLSSCQQEEDFAPQEQEIRIATRSTSDEGATATFTDDFTLVLSSTTDNTKYETHSVTYTNGTGWNAVKSSILPAHAFAYKGSSVTGISYTDKWNYTVTLQTDQSDATKLANADVMIATGNATKDSPLDLNFQHYYAKVTFNVVLASQFDPLTDEISGFDVVTCELADVKPCVDGNSYTAVIPANPYYRIGVAFAWVKINEKRLEVEIPDEYANPNGSFEAGKHYTFDLTVGKDKVTLTPTTTNTDLPGGWDIEDNMN